MSVLLVLAALQQKPEFARIATLQSEADWKPVDALVAQIDGEGEPEVLVVSSSRSKVGARRVEVWKLGTGAATLAKAVDLTPDVVAIATGDVLPAVGEELVLFNAGGAFALSPLAAKPQAERLAECDFLWQVPDPARAFLWQDGVADLDGDGLVDLVLPEPGGFAVVMQRRPRREGEAWGVASRVRVPEEADGAGVWLSATRREGPAVRGSRKRPSFTLELTGGEENETLGSRPPALVQTSESVSAPFFLDWDADSDLDLFVQTTHHLHVFLQEGGRFKVVPELTRALPFEIDAGRRLDTSYSSHVVDLDRDKRADCVIFAGDKRSEDIRTQALFFAQAAMKSQPLPFGKDGTPTNLLVFAGFISGPRFVDLDADGYPELVLRAVRPDLIDQLRSVSTQSIEADLLVYRNRKGVLARQPEISLRRSIPIERFQLTAEFLGDLTGDGLSELVMRDEPEKLRVLFVRAQGAGDKQTWSVFEKPLWETAVHEDAAVELVPARAGLPRPALLVTEPNQVLFVRFR